MAGMPTITSPTQPAATPAGPPSPPRGALLRTGFVAASWAALVGLAAVTLPVLLLWAGDDRSTAGFAEALRTAGALWLLGHGAPLQSAGGSLGLVPLGLAVVPLVLLVRAGRHVAERVPAASRGDALRVVAGLALPYALVVSVVAGLARSAALRPSPLAGALGALALAALAAGSGVVRAAGAGTVLPAVPARWRRAASGALVASAALLSGGALLVAAALAGRAGAVHEQFAGGSAAGGLGLLLVSIVLLPNAAVWAASWLAGPGFAVGVATSVTPFGAAVGPLPALPLLAAVPHADPPGIAALALLVPVAAGALGGLVVARRGGGAAEALLTGPIAGLAAAAAAALSSGPLGDGRLSDVGPSPAVGLAVAAEVALGAVAVVVVRGLRPGR